MFTQLILVNLILASSSASRHDRSIIKNRRINPGQQIVWTLDFKPEIPDHCRDQGLCEDVPNYPHEYMDHLLRNNAAVRSVLSFTLGAYDTERGCKGGENPRIHELCAFTTQLFKAKAAQDNNGRWYHLLPGQFLCLELCKGTASPCSNATISVSKGYKSICNQKLTRKRMMSLDTNGTWQYTDVEKIQSGCCCQIVSVD